jgi:outer membrane lipoprotein carrier protein
MLLVAVAVLNALLPQAPSHSRLTPASAQEIVAAIDARHRGLRDFEARFVQVYRSGVLGQEVIESGSLRFKRPGRMRWEYRKPERKLFVCDGARYYFYVPADRQVIVRVRGGDQGLAFRLLSGEIAIAREFTPVVEQAGPDTTRLRLTPRRPDAEVQSIVLDVDSAFRLRALEIRDLQDNVSQFRFEDIRENRGFADGDFRFEIPAGVEVLRE